MALQAIALPILPGKSDQWQQMEDALKGSRREQFIASRALAKVRERTFLQHTPAGDLVIVTIEGEDPATALSQIGRQGDEFSRWFIEQVREIHGIDLTKLPLEIPRLVFDTGADE